MGLRRLVEDPYSDWGFPPSPRGAFVPVGYEIRKIALTGIPVSTPEGFASFWGVVYGAKNRIVSVILNARRPASVSRPRTSP